MCDVYFLRISLSIEAGLANLKAYLAANVLNEHIPFRDFLNECEQNTIMLKAIRSQLVMVNGKPLNAE